jgi:hypothetical protein
VHGSTQPSLREREAWLRIPGCAETECTPEDALHAVIVVQLLP